MNPICIRLPILAACVALAAAPVLPASRGAGTESAAPAGVLVPVNDKTDAAWLSKARDEYPLANCVVSGEGLHGNGPKSHDWVFKQAGRPDRLIRFCCNSCNEDFMKDPQKYLRAIDQADASEPRG